MMETADKIMTVAAIKQGTVIDHIPAGQALRIASMLRLNKHRKKVSLGLNLPSKLLEYKDLIKIEDKELTAEEANQVSILAPQATISIIQNFEIVKKFKVQTPDSIANALACPNPTCITNHENIGTFFNLSEYKKSIQLHCKFCKKLFSHEEIKVSDERNVFSR